MKLLVVAIDGKGLGHLNRTLLMAKSLKAVEPEAEVRFLVESPAFPLVEMAGFPVLKLPDPMHDLGRLALSGRRTELEIELVTQVARAVRPDSVLFDFFVNPRLFEGLQRLGCRVLVVLRRLSRQAMEQLAAGEASKLVDAWLLPHRPDEFRPGEIPSALASRSHFTGPLVRALEPTAVPEVKSRYLGGADDSRLILISLGGGGWPGAARLAREARQAVTRLQQQLQGLQAVVVYGPLFGGELPAEVPGIRSVRFEPQLPELMAVAEVVVCSAGYNSVAEVVASGTPAVLVPLSDPGNDDQQLRAMEASKSGRVLVAGLDQGEIGEGIFSVLSGGGPPRLVPQPGGGQRTAGQVLAGLLLP